MWTAVSGDSESRSPVITSSEVCGKSRSLGRLGMAGDDWGWLGMAGDGWGWLGKVGDGGDG